MRPRVRLDVPSFFQHVISVERSFARSLKVLFFLSLSFSLSVSVSLCTRVLCMSWYRWETLGGGVQSYFVHCYHWTPT